MEACVRRLSALKVIVGSGVFAMVALAVKAETISEDFTNGLGIFSPLTPTSWANEEAGVEGIAALMVEGIDRPPVRRPREFLLLEKYIWTDYDVRVRALSREDPAAGGNDVVVIFGYQDFSHFYYAHVSNDSGTFHNVIVKVHGDERSVITIEEERDPRLTEGWHDIEVRHESTGAISVYVDDMSAPNMTAFDQDYQSGAVGMGSFDNIAWFDDAEVSGELVKADVSLSIDEDLRLGLNADSSMDGRYVFEESQNMKEWNAVDLSLLDGSGEGVLGLKNGGAQSKFYRVRFDSPLLPVFDE